MWGIHPLASSGGHHSRTHSELVATLVLFWPSWHVKAVKLILYWPTTTSESSPIGTFLREESELPCRRTFRGELVLYATEISLTAEVELLSSPITAHLLRVPEVRLCCTDGSSNQEDAGVFLRSSPLRPRLIFSWQRFCSYVVVSTQ